MKYMLDTNICIYAQKKNVGILREIKNNWEDGLAISSITLAELEYGVQKSQNPEKNMIALMQFLSIVSVIPFDTGAAAEYGRIRTDLERQGKPIGSLDMLIAAHARFENLTIITHNTREFERVKDLKLTDWYSE